MLAHDDPLLVHLTIADTAITTTSEHPFFVEGHGWVEAARLWVGAPIHTASGGVGRVQALALEQRTQRMYNLTVATAHTFFVGEGGWLVHNSCGGGLARRGEDLFVGTYNQVRGGNLQSGLNTTHTPHHIPQDAITPGSHGTGITINLRKDLHQLTSSFGNRNIATANLRDAIARDIQELRTILRNAGYDRLFVNRQLQELIRQNKDLYGGLPK